jgi:hypothetical protein
MFRYLAFILAGAGCLTSCRALFDAIAYVTGAVHLEPILNRLLIRNILIIFETPVALALEQCWLHLRGCREEENIYGPRFTCYYASLDDLKTIRERFNPINNLGSLFHNKSPPPGRML